MSALLTMNVWGLAALPVALGVLTAVLSAAAEALPHMTKAKVAKWCHDTVRLEKVLALLAAREAVTDSLRLALTLVHMMAGAVAVACIARVWAAVAVHPALFALFTVPVFCLYVTATVLIPQGYASQRPNRTGLFLLPVTRCVTALLFPVVWVIEKCVNGVLEHLDVPRTGVTLETQEEVLRGAIDQLAEAVDDAADNETQEKRAMLRSILDLEDVYVEEIMVHRKNVKMINADLPVAEIVDEAMNSAYTRLPLWKDNPNNVIGVLNAKLLLQEMRHCQGDLDKLRLERAMLEPWFIPDTATLFEQLQAFRSRREHFAIMVDEYGDMTGVVTLEDILEEIVGEIDDEHDTAVLGVRPQADGSYLVEGKVTIRDLNRALDWGIPDEEYATVAGLLFHETQRIPNVGQSFAFYGFRFDVMRKQRNQLTVIRVTPPESQIAAPQAMSA